MTPPQSGKICVICGQDCSNKPRTKDAKGRYCCKSCHESVMARRRQTTPVRAAEPVEEVGDYGLEAPAQVRDNPAATRDIATTAQCPSCGQALTSGALICVPCGIHVMTARPLMTAELGDTDRVRENARSILWFFSWFEPLGICPVASEAHGSSKPYAIRSIAAVTIALSLFVWLFALTGSSQMRSLKNLYMWEGSAEPEAEYLEALYEYTEWGDRRAFEHKKTELAMTTPPHQLALAAHNALPRSKRCVGEFHWWQLLTHAFLHGDFLHLAGNLVFMLIFGSRINALIGNIGMLILYPLLAIASALPQMVSVRNEMPTASLGASGAIMGLAGMYFVFFPVIRVHVAAWIRVPVLLFGMFRCRSFWILLFFISFDVIYTALNLEDGVAHWAHLGGFIAGVAVALGLLIGRGVNAHGSDILSVTLGRHAWPIIGKPSQWRNSAHPEGWLGSLRMIPQGAMESLRQTMTPQRGLIHPPPLPRPPSSSPISPASHSHPPGARR